MRRRMSWLWLMLALAVCLGAWIGESAAWAKEAPLSARESRVAPPAAASPLRLPQVVDTLWFGGDNGHGIALRDGLWDWDTDLPPGDPLHGWISVDQTVFPGTWFRRVTHEDAPAHGDLCDPVFGDTEALIWCGLHEDEATWHDFEAGLGYGNEFCQQALSPEFPIEPAAEDLEIRFRYFNDTEEDYDFTQALILGFDAAAEEIEEFAIAELTGIIGAPESPQDFHALLTPGTLDPNVVTARVALRMTSDGGWSDQDGSWDTRCGAFAADDVEIRVGESFAETYTFEEGTQGWSFDLCGAVGSFMASIPEDQWWPWLHEAGVYECSMSGNAVSFVDTLDNPWWPPGHPEGHHEMALSSAVPRAEIGAEDLLGAPVRFDTYGYPCDDIYNCTYYRIGYVYYPYTTPINPEPRWSPRGGTDVWSSFGEAGCLLTGGDLMHPPDGNPLPADWDSMRVVYEVVCSTFDQSGCETMGAPMIDNFRVGFAYEDLSGIDDPPAAHESRHPSLEAARFDARDGSARLSFDLPAGTEIVLAIFDSAGRLVRTLCSRPMEAGPHSVAWDGCYADGRRVARGLYRARLSTVEGYEVSRPVLIIR